MIQYSLSALSTESMHTEGEMVSPVDLFRSDAGDLLREKTGHFSRFATIGGKPVSLSLIAASVSDKWCLKR